MLYFSTEKKFYLLLYNGSFNDEAKSLISALTLGLRDDLDEEMVDSFRNSGAMHIMAVSGLHVGILQMILNLILIFLRRIKYGNIIRMFSVILFLWFYALLTGLSPSVLRAVIMFSLIQIGMSIGREISIFNIIAASALISLIIDSYQLFSIGFQFSYIAVCGIIILYPLVHKLIKSKYLLVDKIWSLLVVSFCAQLSLAPLSIYYFNQFPGYFLLTNLFVIPLAFLIVISAVGLFLFSFSDLIQSILSAILNFLCKLISDITEIVSGLPGALIDNIYLHKITMLLIYLMIILFVSFIILKYTILLKSLLVTFILCLSFQIVRQRYNINEAIITVFNSGNSSAVSVFSNHSGIVLTDSLLYNNKRKYDFYMGKYLLSKNVDYYKQIISSKTNIKHNGISCYDNFILIDNKLIAIINCEKYAINKVKDKLRVDILILSGTPQIRIEELTDNFEFRNIIADSSNKRYKVNEWLKECEMLGISLYDVASEGAFHKILK